MIDVRVETVLQKTERQGMQDPGSGRSPDSPDDYNGRGQDPRYPHKKRRKSFFGDLFDF